MVRKNMYIAVALALLVVVLFILLGFFGLRGGLPFGGQAAAPATADTGPQQLLNELGKTGGVSSLHVYQTVAGSGVPAKVGDTLIVEYVGALPDGTVFDASANHPETADGFSFVLGGNVIQGWNQALLGATVGEQLLVAVPPQLGYGTVANGPIPANSTLIFQIKVLGITPAH